MGARGHMAATLAAMALGACATTAADTATIELPVPAAPDVPRALPAPSAALGKLRPEPMDDDDAVSVEVLRYAFTETDAEDFVAAVTEAARAQGLDHLARTDWRIRWNFALDPKIDGSCLATASRTALSVRYVLPDWQPDGAPEPWLRREWDRFATALDTHEYGHALIGMQAKQAIDALVTGDPDPAGCRALRRRLNQTAKAITQQGRDAAYDALTGHGRTQGAVLDVSDGAASGRPANVSP